jgi:hypothetical protein
MEDPRSKYPKPPFREQDQPWASRRVRFGRRCRPVAALRQRKKYESFGSKTSPGRPGQPAELASIYVQLAASDASFATGNIYVAPGGQGQP